MDAGRPVQPRAGAVAIPRARTYRRENRFALTLKALAILLVAWVGVVMVGVSTVGLTLVAVWVGIPVLLAATGISRPWINAHRRAVTGILGERVVPPYRGYVGGGWFARLRWVLTDIATWRDLVWLLVNATAGVVLTAAVLGLFGVTLFYLAYPLLLAVSPPNVFERPFGFVDLEQWWQGFACWPLAAIAGVAWWWATPGLMRAWAFTARSLLGPTSGAVLQGRVEALAASRADTVDTAAAEIRRIERDLHDGAQARLVALGMSLGMADEVLTSDPARARVLLGEAREATSTVLADLRNLVRGIHPPLLADRGLVGAVRAMALDAPVPTTVRVQGFDTPADARLPAPIEACAWFVVSEALANIGKHAGARRAHIRLERGPEMLSVSVADDGRGGAVGTAGSGLVGLEHRLAAFDGSLSVTSPPGGPTILTMEIPCAP